MMKIRLHFAYHKGISFAHKEAMTLLSRRTVLLKPMQPGLSGYARLQTEGGQTLLQLNARGMESGEEAVLYRYTSDRRAQEAARGRANAHGEVSLTAESAGQGELTALILIGGSKQTKPLLIGMCAPQDAGRLMDVKNAAMALCERYQKPKPSAVRPVSAPKPPAPKAAALPREVFLPAIDPAPYAQAFHAKEEDPLLPPPKRDAPPADRLRPLIWPRGYESLKPYFDNALPCALFDLPDWRFVYAAHAGGPNGLWLGRQQLDGRVCGVAYIHRGEKPPAGGQPYRPLRGTDGQMYQALWQKI